MSGDMQQWKRKTYAKAELAHEEMPHPSSRVRSRQDLALGAPEYDEDVWQPCEPEADRSKHFDSGWEELDNLMYMSTGRSGQTP